LNKLRIAKRIGNKREASNDREDGWQPGKNQTDTKQGSFRLCHIGFVANIGQHCCRQNATNGIVVLEGGWATTASEFGDNANEANQARYYREVSKWAEDTNTTFMFFEDFDEPWKGNPENPAGAEKHWGLFKVDRTPKQVMELKKLL